MDNRTTGAQYDVNAFIDDLFTLNIRPKDFNHPLMGVSPDTIKGALRGAKHGSIQRECFPDYSRSSVTRWLSSPNDHKMDAEKFARLVDGLARIWNKRDTGDTSKDASGAGVSVTRRRVLLAILGKFSKSESVKAYTARTESVDGACRILAYVAADIGLPREDMRAIARIVLHATEGEHSAADTDRAALQLRTALELADMGVMTAAEVQTATRDLLSALEAKGRIDRGVADGLMEECMP